MKLFLEILVVILFGLVGFSVKYKYIAQKEFLLFIKNFIEFLEINISICKDNINEIINSYLIQQNNKNAKFVNFFRKNDILSQFDEKIIQDQVYDVNLKNYLIAYFLNIGKSNQETEIQNAKHILRLIESGIDKTNEEIKTKGDLYFKIWLAIGIAAGVVIW